MENFYLILVIILFALAISDLIVGVSNDAVNFLSSAIGSKAARKWVIYTVASLGVLVGATFSSGMMEVARKGIFHPDMFVFSEIMIIFLAVMITDIILLDMFNTFGLPTSTTVSIVFELLGAAVAVSLVKIYGTDGNLGELANYINTGKALAIITGILLSVFIAFAVGAIIQYLSRLMFSFKYQKNLKYFAGLFGGLAIASITYFMIIKGAKGASFMTEETIGFLKDNMFKILAISLIGWTIILQLLYWLFKIDIPKIIVLIGTFALAMAFAGNDLVNFIGVPLAGFESFKAWSSQGVSPDAFQMSMLTGKVSTPTYMLLIAGFIMIITLITSRKARSVVTTTLDLSSQNESDERFQSSMFSRLLVRSSVNINKQLERVFPGSVNRFLKNRFQAIEDLTPSIDQDKPAFDKIRASVNLIVASILISLGTSLKLPLSTTYVTFMVAMGTSLSDRAWDRESAVYRISGVFTVISGWFLTALIAFSISGFIAFLISIGGKILIFVFVAIAFYMIVRTYKLFKRKNAEKLEEDEDMVAETDANEQVIAKSLKQVVIAIISSNQIFTMGIEGFINEDRNGLKKAEKASLEFSKKAKKHKDKVYSTVQKLSEGSIDTSHFYVQMMDYKREIAHAVHFLLQPMANHMDNQHKPFSKSQQIELSELIERIDSFFNYVLHTVKDEKFENIDSLIEEREKIINFLGIIEKNQIKRIKNGEVNTRNSQLFFKINSETKNILLHVVNLVKSQRDFITQTRQE